MESNDNIFENKRKCLPLGWDGLFKKVFGNEDKPQNIEMLLSLIFNIPYEELKNKTQILNNDKVLSNDYDKKQSQDIVLKVFLGNEENFINLEANIHGFDESIINRNLSYITYIFSKQLKRKISYSSMIPVIQINFTKHGLSEKNNDCDRIVDTYLLTNQHSEILTQKLQIIDIYIENCYNIWYNRNIKKFTSYEQTIIRLGALHYINNVKDFRKCLGEIKMNDDVRKSIQDDFEEYQNDQDLVLVYDREEHLEKLRKSYEIMHNKKMLELDAKSDELNAKSDELNAKSDELNAKSDELNAKSVELNAKSDELNERARELLDREKKLNDKAILWAKKLKALNIEFSEICDITGLSVDFIKSLKV